MATDLPTLASLIGISISILIFLLIWTLVWKGFALWKSARLNQPLWFIVLMIVNTFGILEILYLFIFSKYKPNSSKKRKVKKRK